jgi:lipid II:glycine glycyltransferase (peptidoglycan interpeptide bridge formation enzyme)
VFAIEENTEYSALVVVTLQKEKGVKSYFSRRGIIYGGPVILGNRQRSLENLLKEVVRYYQGKLIYLETRNYFDYSLFKSSFISSGFDYNSWLNFHLDTSPELPVIKKTMSSSRLRQIKKAIKNGAEWKEAESETDVVTFYNILLDLYKNKIKKPLFPKEFFLEFYKQNLGKYLLVYFEGKVIGGIICPIMPNKAIYEFYVCGLDSEYKNQYPSVMATWAAMEYANQNDIPLFDFMGAGSPDEAYGVREFKSRFGGEEVEYGRFINILNPTLYKTGVLGLKVLSKLKK